MKTFKQLREECGCKDKERKAKKKGNVEIMPTIRDGQKGMVTKPTNESTFAGNYEGPLYAPHPDIIQEKSVSKAQQRFMGMVHAAKKGEKPASSEVAKAASSMTKKAAKDFASTKHKGLPEKKKEKK